MSVLKRQQYITLHYIERARIRATTRKVNSEGLRANTVRLH